MDEQWPQVEALFVEALARAPAARSAFVERACGDDLELRRQVESLLAADREAGTFLDQPALGSAPDLPQPDSADLPEGTALGRYRILRPLGQGGMATVYLAVREQDYQQQVAVKVFAHGRQRRDLVRRFEHERQILASLEHPSIARLLDGGSTPEGLPYLVMERVEGVPIDLYCDRRDLDLDARIDLFRRLAEAVHYAHQRLVVHRDLKPSNILVTASGTPKLLDFGIAKLVAPDALGEDAFVTADGQRLMTPAYASPEQVRGDAITTASDVYSMGVLLYRLLTGRLPYQLDGAISDYQRAILETDPEKPSAAVLRPAEPAEATDPESSTTRDITTATQLRRQLTGDLDNILLRALRKDPSRRYGSVEQLSEDLRRYRQGLPVSARPETFGYVARKFVRRHRLGVAAVAAFLVLILGSAVFMSLLARRVVVERDEARRERDTAEQVAAFLEDIFEVSDPIASRGAPVTAREILDRGAERMEAELADQPEIFARLAATVAKVYLEMGHYDQAEPLLDQALLRARQALPRGDPQITEIFHQQGVLWTFRGDLDRAAEALQQALSEGRRAEGGLILAVTLNQLGVVRGMQGDLAGCRPLLEEALALRREALSPDDPEIALTLTNLGMLHQAMGDLDRAEALSHEALEIWLAAGEDHPALVGQSINLASLARAKGDFEATEAHYLRALEVGRRVLGPEHPETVVALGGLGSTLAHLGEPEAAADQLGEALGIQRRSLGDDHPRVAVLLNSLGHARLEAGQAGEAEAPLAEAREILSRSLGEDHAEVAVSIDLQARARLELGDLEAAERLFRRSLELRRAALGEDHHRVGESLVGLGSVLTRAGDATAAEPLLHRGLAILRAELPTGHRLRAEAEGVLGACLVRLGRFAEAEPLLLASFEALDGQRGPKGYRQMARARVVELYERWDQPQAAAAYRAE